MLTHCLALAGSVLITEVDKEEKAILRKNTAHAPAMMIS
jgi:hypothetical protein